MAEVYFASTRQITDLKWGTPNPVLMRDPDFGLGAGEGLRNLHPESRSIQRRYS